MQSLGLMEFRGFVDAVNGLDVALKAANVELQCGSKDGGGLVSVFVTGQVGAVNAAISAVQSALGERLLESSVIPRPAAQVAELLEQMPMKAVPKPEPQQEPRTEPAERESGEAQEEPLAAIEDELRREEEALDAKLSAMTLKELKGLLRAGGAQGWSAERLRRAKKSELIAAIKREQER